jgi:hypothetical protein
VYVYRRYVCAYPSPCKSRVVALRIDGFFFVINCVMVATMLLISLDCCCVLNLGLYIYNLHIYTFDYLLLSLLVTSTVAAPGCCRVVVGVMGSMVAISAGFMVVLPSTCFLSILTSVFILYIHICIERGKKQNM